MLFRTGIRHATAAMLTDLGRFHAVFNARAPVITREHLPCVKLFTPDESSENLSIGAPELRGTLTLIIQVVIEGQEDVANAQLLDDLCEAVQRHLLEDSIWLQFMNRVLSVDTTIETNTEGEMRTVTASMSWTLQYGDLYTTKIVDFLNVSHHYLPVPDQPDLPTGGDVGDLEKVEFEIDHTV